MEKNSCEKFYFLDKEKNREIENILNTLMKFESQYKEETYTYKYKKLGFKVTENSYSKVI